MRLSSNQRIWILSDLHQEFLRDREHGSDPLTLFDPFHWAPDHFDVVVLAGDIDVPLTRSLAWVADRFAGVEVVYVPGNHDFFVADQGQYTLVEQLDKGRELADRLGIHLLADSTAVIAGTRFAGGTLWTDFMTAGRGDFRAKIAEAAGRDGMNDYRRIKRWSTANPDKRKRLRPMDTIASHHHTRAFIEAELAKPFAGRTVVVTHHCPHPTSLSPTRQRLEWCYASNLSTVLHSPTAPDLWVHGHVHHHCDYQIGGTRVVANPRGYQFDEGDRDNGFEAGFVVELPAKLIASKNRIPSAT